MNKELLFKITKKDFEINWFSGHGAGGQKRNKCKNCCRLKHIESGATGIGQSQKSQIQNKKDALLNLINSDVFKNWHRIKCGQILGTIKDIDEIYNQWLRDENFKYEININGEFIEVDKSYFENNDCEVI